MRCLQNGKHKNWGLYDTAKFTFCIRSTSTASAILMSPDLPVFCVKVWLARLDPHAIFPVFQSCNMVAS